MIRSRRAICGAVLLLSSWCPAADVSPILDANFNKPDALLKWRGSGGKLVAGPNGTCLLLEAAGKNSYSNRTIDLPVDRIAGKLITIRAAVKAADVSKPPKPWNGIKIMIVARVGSDTAYPQITLPRGTFDWVKVRRSIRLPKNISSVKLQLGLEQVAGKVWFADLRITLGRGASGGRRLEKPFKGHNLKRLRGVMHGPEFDEKNIRDLAAWGANHIRWQLNWVPMKSAEQWAKDLDRVIYSFHMYQPHIFTHQFRRTKEFPKGIEYPGAIRGVKWDKARLLAAMQPAIDFQREFNVQIYVGEFSAIRWAPNESAHRYTRDLIELFEAAGWDWAYHAYREWQGWSVEHGIDKSNTAPSGTPTKRKKLLLNYFATNQHPEAKSGS